MAISCAAALLLSSCLRLETVIRLKRNGVVTARLVYTIAPEMADFGRSFGSDEPWPLPLTEKDFEQQALRVDGVELTGYRTHKLADESERIIVRLAANSMESIAGYLVLDFAAEKQGKGGALVFTLPIVDGYESADGERREILDKIAGDSVFRFVFEPPSKPVSVSSGGIDGRRAVLEVSLRELLYEEAPKTWEVRW